MFEVEQHARFRSGIALVHENRSTTQQVPITFKGEIQNCIEQRMTWTDERGERLAGRCDQVLLERDPLVSSEYGISSTDQAIAVANGRWYVRDLIAPVLSLSDRATKSTERFEKERFNIMRLEPTSLGTFHVFADAGHATGIHRI